MSWKVGSIETYESRVVDTHWVAHLPDERSSIVGRGETSWSAIKDLINKLEASKHELVEV